MASTPTTNRYMDEELDKVRGRLEARFDGLEPPRPQVPEKVE